MSITMTPPDAALDWEGWLRFNFPDAKAVYGATDEWLVLCPFHADRNPSMAVNTHKAVFVCRSCGARGHLSKLRERTGGNAPPASFSGAVLRRKLTEAGTPGGMMPMLSTSWLGQFSPDDGYWSETRGLRDETIERYRLCIDYIERQAIIPVYWQGSLRGVIRRQLSPYARPKYKFPRHLPRRELLWGYDQAKTMPVRHLRNAFGKRPVMLTEGQVDAMAASETGVRTVALGGNFMTREQREWLMKLDPTSVLVALDNDVHGIGHDRIPAHGRQDEQPPTGTWRVGAMVRTLPVFVVDWGRYKDPAEVRNVAERTELVRSAVRFRDWKTACQTS